MDTPLLVLALVGFLGGLLLVSRTLGWLLGLREALRGPTSGRAWPAALLLHAGPWLLLAAGLGIRFVAVHERPALLQALLGGAFVALVFVAAFTSRASGPPRPVLPSTPERLVAKRRRFFVVNIGVFTVATIVAAPWIVGDAVGSDPGVAILLVLVSPLEGWLWSWMMWQWYGTALEVAEKHRLQREARDAGSHPASAGPGTLTPP